ncbi:MAG: GTPase Era, partial [Francisellaceae bacterium]|nr:GTPase Era [Francisellaceae bacterium]
KFRAAEIIREKLTRLLGKELPYALTIEIESFKKEEKVYRIQALIWVERKSQRPIILGAEGNRLKEIATRARLDLQGLLGEKVYLRIWVKVKHNWSDDERALKSLGYEDFESD